MKKLASLTLALGLVSLSGVAQAQEFGTQGRAVFGAERLFGVTWSHHWLRTQNPAQPDPVEDNTEVSFLWHQPANIFSAPRVTFDYFVIDHLSVGGTLAYASWTTSHPNEVPRPADTSNSQFAFMPRVGYAYMFGSVVGIWPHGGLMYHSGSFDDGNGRTDKGSGFAFDLDALFVFAITPHFGFTVGPTFDVDLGGSHTVTPPGVSQDEHFRQFGIQAGLLGWL
jgi:hypothetical protein